MTRVLRRAAWALALIAALRSADAMAQETPKAPVQPPTARSLDPPAGALVVAGNPPDLIFLYTGDVIGYIEPCG